MDTVKILKTEITKTTVEKVAVYLNKEKGKTVAICNANTLVRSYNNSSIQNKINSFDIKAPDGFPVAKASKILYQNNQKRVDGFKVINKTIEAGLEKKTSHYFFGSNEKVINSMLRKLKDAYPTINIAGYICPPVKSYKELSKNHFVQDMIQKNPDIVWVSLGFPKQEEFIFEIKNKYEIYSNMVGVGAVFEWVAGTKFKAPEWIANLGLEWILRLIQEPKRLFRRYLIDNFLFIIYFIRQYLVNRKLSIK